MIACFQSSNAKNQIKNSISSNYFISFVYENIVEKSLLKGVFPLIPIPYFLILQFLNMTFVIFSYEF